MNKIKIKSDSQKISVEELKSINDKLNLENVKLREELNRLQGANNETGNLLSNYDAPAVFLNRELEIKRVTHNIKDIPGFEHPLVNRHISSISPTPLLESIEEDCLSVLRNSQTIEREITTNSGSCFIRQIIPDRASDNQPQGLLLIFQLSLPQACRNQAVEERENQQSVLASLGIDALAGNSPQDLMDRIVQSVAQTLNVEYCTIFKHLPMKNEFLEIATNQEVKKFHITTDQGEDASQLGYTLHKDAIVIVDHFSEEERFNVPGFLKDENIESSISCRISHGQNIYGVLSIHTQQHRLFTRSDADFLVAVANLLSRDIVMHKAQEKLFASEKKFRSLANVIPQLAWYTNSEGSIQWYNQRWYDFTGTTYEEVKGWGWDKVHHPDHIDRVVKRFKKAIKEGKPWEDTFPLRRSDGEYRWFLSRAMPMRDSNDENYYWFGTNTDITEQRNYEKAMRESEDRLNMAKEAACIGIQSIDLTTRIVYIDDTIRNIWGLPSTISTISLEDFESVIVPEDIDNYRDCIKQAIIDQKSFICEFELINQNNTSIITVESRGRVIFHNNKPVQIFGTIQEITERRKAEQTQKLLSAIVASTDDAVISKNLDDLVTSWNPGAENLFGFSAEEMIGQPISKVIPKHKHAESNAILKRLRAGESIENFETVRINRAGNLLNVSVTWSPLRNASGTVIGAAKVVRDITYHKAMQIGLEEKSKTLEERNQQLIQIKSKLEKADTQKNHFLAILGHELRNPLSSIAGALEVIRLSPDKAESLIEVMGKSTSRIVTLLDDMLDLSRISLGQIRLKRKAFDLREAIHEAKNAVKAAYKSKEQILSLEIPDEPIWVHADPTRIEQVCINLLMNAVKYTPDQGIIRIYTENNQNQVHVTVADNGIGIEDDMLDRIFEPFFSSGTTTNTPESMGIGLSLVKHLIELHDGVVIAQSPGPNMGTNVSFTLPLVSHKTNSRSEEKLANKASLERTLSGLRVALVDDNFDAIIGIKILLEHHNCEVMVSSNGKDALINAKQFNPSVFIIDIGMPGMTGYELATCLREEGYSDALIIALSGYGHTAAHQLSFESGIDHHINKPLSFNRLLDLLRSWLIDN